VQAITDNSVSVFELVTSGAISRLTAYLQGNDLPASVRKDEQLLCRLRAFTVAALAAHDQQQPMDVDGAPAAAAGGAAAAAAAAAGGVPLAALVRKLQGALASTEAFPVMCSRLVPSGGALGGAGSGRSLSRSAGLSGSFSRSTLSSGLHALTQPFKLRLVRHDTVGCSPRVLRA
jgi:E3 ubiquitin-protein ligase TRIP12